VQWLEPIIKDIWEAEIRTTEVQGQKVSETRLQLNKKAAHGDKHLLSQTCGKHK
jgi:hypothetical protein